MTTIANANVSTAIVQVIAQFGSALAFAGTGFFVDANTLVTALHILVRDGVVASALWVKTAAGEMISVAMDAVHYGYPPDEWRTSGVIPNGQFQHDFATVSTGTKAVGLDVGYFNTNPDFVSGQVHISGLPKDVFTELTGNYQDFTGANAGISLLSGLSSPGVIPGFSGSPVWVSGDSGVPEVVGVATLGNPVNTTLGGAVDFSPQVVAQVLQWAQADDYQVGGLVFLAHLQNLYGLVGLNLSAGDTAYWMDQYHNHGLTVDGLYPVALTVVSIRVALLYDTVFNRAPDLAGLQFWAGAMDSGMQFLEVVARFVDSPEFHTLYGAPSVPDFVELLYNNILDRPSDPAGKQYWVGQVNEKGINAVIAGVSDSPEHLKLLANPNPLAYVSDVQHVTAVDQAHAPDVAPVSGVAEQVEIVGVNHAANSDLLLNIA